MMPTSQNARSYKNQEEADFLSLQIRQENPNILKKGGITPNRNLEEELGSLLENKSLY